MRAGLRNQEPWTETMDMYRNHGHVQHTIHVQIIEVHNFSDLLFPKISWEQFLQINSFEHMVF